MGAGVTPEFVVAAPRVLRRQRKLRIRTDDRVPYAKTFFDANYWVDVVFRPAP
jgi:hypothetical protein